jgi:hypothetical protein
MSEVLEAARNAAKLSKLELDMDDRDDGAGLDKTLAGIRQSHCSLLKSLPLQINELKLNAMQGLLCLSTLTKLNLECSEIVEDAAKLIQPGSWPCLRVLNLESHTYNSKPPVNIFVAFNHPPYWA